MTRPSSPARGTWSGISASPPVRREGRAPRHTSRGGQARAGGLLVEAAHTRDPDPGPVARVSRQARGPPRQAGRALRDRSQANGADLASAHKRGGLSLRLAHDHPAQAPDAAAYDRRQRPENQSRRREPSANYSSVGSWRRLSATSRAMSRSRRTAARVPPTGTRLFRPSKRQTMRGRLHSPQMPALLVRGRPRQKGSLHPAPRFHPDSRVRTAGHVSGLVWVADACRGCC